MPASGNFGIRLSGLFHRQVVGGCDEKLQPGVMALEPFQVHFSEFHRTHLARDKQRGEISHRPKRHVLQIRRALNRRLIAHLHRTAKHIELHAGENGAEADAWNDVVWERDLPQMLVMIEMAVHIGDQELALGVGELQAGNSLGSLQHVERDPRRLLCFEARPENSGQ